jgi:hypothetical protein
MPPPKIDTTGSLLEKFFGETVCVEDLPPTDDLVRKTKNLGDTFTEMVDVLRSDNLQPEKIRQLGALLWCLVGSRITPLACGPNLPSLHFWAEKKSEKSLACIMCPPTWMQMVKKDPFLQFGGLVFVGSQARDYYNGKLDRQSDGPLVMERSRAFEAEYLHFLASCDFDVPIFMPNDYQKEVMKRYPKGLASLDPGLWYESKPWEGPIP